MKRREKKASPACYLGHGRRGCDSRRERKEGGERLYKKTGEYAEWRLRA